MGRVGGQLELFLPSAAGEMLGVPGTVKRIERRFDHVLIALSFCDVVAAREPRLRQLFDRLLTGHSGTQGIMEALLVEEARHAVLDMPKSAVRDMLIEALTACEDGLLALDALDLSRFEAVDIGLADLTVWNEVAPEVQRMLAALHATLKRLAGCFVSREGASAAENIEVTRAHERLAPLVGMLRMELGTFGGRLRQANVVAHRWTLLGELHELRGKCCQCLETIVVDLLELFIGPVSSPLPRRTRAATEAACLRAAVTDLAFSVRSTQSLRKEDTLDDAGVRTQLVSFLDEFGMGPAYRLMRARDKRELNSFRMSLSRWGWGRREGDSRSLTDVVEGLACFLEALRGMNQRPELRRHDAEQLETLLEESLSDEQARERLVSLYGLCPRLDGQIRAARKRPPDWDGLRPLLEETLASLER